MYLVHLTNIGNSQTKIKQKQTLQKNKKEIKKKEIVGLIRIMYNYSSMQCVLYNVFNITTVV